MRFMLVCALAFAAGCSGGGGTTMATAQLSGTVYEIDGQSAVLGGVQVTLMETGEQAWTDANGGFAFTGLAPGVYRLDFNAPSFAALALSEEEGEDGIDGEDGDHEDGDVVDGDHEDGIDDHEDEFEDEDGHPKVDVPEGGHVECHVALENGEVKDFSSDHEDGQHAMAKLHLTDAAEIAGYHVEGGVKIAAFADGGTLFKVCVEGLMGGDVIEIFVSETSIGTATADGEGRACLVLENSLPLGAPNLGELAGLRVDVYLSGTDLRLLVGEVPELIDEEDGENGDGDEPGEDDGDKPDEGDDAEDGEDDGDEPGDDDGDEEDDGDKPDDGTDGEGEGDDGEEGDDGV